MSKSRRVSHPCSGVTGLPIEKTQTGMGTKPYPADEGPYMKGGARRQWPFCGKARRAPQSRAGPWSERPGAPIAGGSALRARRLPLRRGLPGRTAPSAGADRPGVGNSGRKALMNSIFKEIPEVPGLTAGLSRSILDRAAEAGLQGPDRNSASFPRDLARAPPRRKGAMSGGRRLPSSPRAACRRRACLRSA